MPKIKKAGCSHNRLVKLLLGVLPQFVLLLDFPNLTIRHVSFVMSEIAAGISIKNVSSSTLSTLVYMCLFLCCT